MTTIQFTPKSEAVPTPTPRTEIPQLDERVWQAWIERNEKRDNEKFVRRVKVLAILAVVLALAGLVTRFW